jgi:hypothetical protein
LDKTAVRWVAVDGSIFTEDRFEVSLPFKAVKLQQAIAFNVGRDMAQHIVKLHNAALDIERKTA